MFDRLMSTDMNVVDVLPICVCQPVDIWGSPYAYAHPKWVYAYGTSHPHKGWYNTLLYITGWEERGLQIDGADSKESSITLSSFK